MLENLITSFAEPYGKRFIGFMEGELFPKGLRSSRNLEN
jgi:hypothetical protein